MDEDDNDEVFNKTTTNPFGGKKRSRRQRGRRNKRARTDGNYCNSGFNFPGGKDDDEENPPEARKSARCHSNVYIKQNVNVK